jgi:hypothetical protein
MIINYESDSNTKGVIKDRYDREMRRGRWPLDKDVDVSTGGGGPGKE